MSLSLPEGLKQTLLYGSSVAFMKGLSLLMLPFIAHHLSPEAFGRLEVVSTLAVIGSILVGMGLESTLFRFAGTARTETERRQLAANIFTLALIIGVLSWGAGLLFAQPLSLIIPGQPSVYDVQLVLSMLALEGCIAIPLGWLRMRNRVSTFFFFTTGRAFFQAVLVLALLSLERGVSGVLEAGLIAALGQALLLGYRHIIELGFGLTRAVGVRVLIYSVPIVASGLVAFALNGLDRWVLADYAGLIDVALFGVAAKFSLAVILLMQPFGMWWTPRRFAVLDQPDGHEKVARLIMLGVALTLFIAVIVALISPVLIATLLPEDYAAAGQYAVALVAVMALKEMAELVNIGCFVGKTTLAQLLINVVTAIVGVVGMFLWTPFYAVWGIIGALMLAQGLRFILFFIASQHYLRLPYASLFFVATKVALLR